MNNIILSTAMIVVGIALLVVSVVAMESLSADLSRFFTGRPTDRAVWMFIAGSLALIAGSVGTAFGPDATH